MSPRTPTTVCITDPDLAVFLYCARVRLLRCEPAPPRSAYVFVDAPPGCVAALRVRFERDVRARRLLFVSKRLGRLRRLARSRPSGLAALCELGDESEMTQ